jgi:hypothetical protein
MKAKKTCRIAESKDFISKKLTDFTELIYVSNKKSYVGNNKSNSLYLEVDENYIKDKSELEKLDWKDGDGKLHDSGNRILREISNIEKNLLSYPKSKIIPITAEDDMKSYEKDKRYDNDFKSKLDGKYPYKVLCAFTKELRVKYKKSNLWVMSIKLSDTGVAGVYVNDRNRQHRLIYEVDLSKIYHKDLVFLNCFGHQIYRYRNDLKNVTDSKGRRAVDPKTGVFSNIDYDLKKFSEVYLDSGKKNSKY